VPWTDHVEPASLVERIAPSVPATRHSVEELHEIAPRSSPTPVCTSVHVPPKSVDLRRVPASPDAKHASVVGHDRPVSSAEVPDDASIKLFPSVVFRTVPPEPTATQCVVSVHDTASRVP
jgi:hypothetical protein